MLALIALACIKPGPVVPTTAPQQAVLGWRLVPGEVLQYELQTTWDQGDNRTRRVELWQYLVRDVDADGVATLEGQMLGLGAQLDSAGSTVDDSRLESARDAEKQRLLGRTIELRVGMEGRLVSLEGVEWADGLTHRLLALQLPTEPVSAGDRWPDPAFARPYADLVPVSLEVTVEGHHTIRDFSPDEGVLTAHIDTEGGVTPESEGAPAVRLEGEASWDLHAGVLHHRTLRASLDRLDGGSPGSLRIELTRKD